jgi:hypothetical protein
VVDCIRDVAPYSLSITYDVTSENCLLVVTPSDGALTLVQFMVDRSGEPHATTRRSIETISNANHWHALTTSSGTFVICHRGRRLVDVQCGQVTELDERRRQDLRRYGDMELFSSSLTASSSTTAHSPDTSSAGSFSPVYAVCDDDGGNRRLFVADQIGNRVLMLDDQLCLERVLLSSESDDKLLEPNRMCYDQTTGRLILAMKDDDCVYVYALKCR